MLAAMFLAFCSFGSLIYLSFVCSIVSNNHFLFLYFTVFIVLHALDSTALYGTRMIGKHRFVVHAICI